MNTPLKNISNYLKTLGKKWQPNGGKQKVKGIWDGRNFNLRYFAEYPYVAILGEFVLDGPETRERTGEEIYTYLVELDSKEQARCYYRWNQVGSDSMMRILDTNTGICVAEWYSADKFVNKDERNRSKL